MENQYYQWANTHGFNLQSPNSCQLSFENWAFRHGFKNEVEIALVSDFLSGMHSHQTKLGPSFAPLLTGLNIKDSLRRKFFTYGEKFPTGNILICDSNIITRIKEIAKGLKQELCAAFEGNHIAPSTGDCRGACQYNVGDRTEYRNYGY